MKTLDQQYEERVTAATKKYREAVETAQQLLSQRLETYQETFRNAIANLPAEDPRYETALSEYDKAAKPLRDAFEQTVRGAEIEWEKEVNAAHEAWHKGMEIPPDSTIAD